MNVPGGYHMTTGPAFISGEAPGGPPIQKFGAVFDPDIFGGLPPVKRTKGTCSFATRDRPLFVRYVFKTPRKTTVEIFLASSTGAATISNPDIMMIVVE
jgi:hypothetical protein